MSIPQAKGSLFMSIPQAKGTLFMSIPQAKGTLFMSIPLAKGTLFMSNVTLYKLRVLSSFVNFCCYKLQNTFCLY